MGSIEVNVHGSTFNFSMYTSTTVGRHIRNSVVIDDTSIPLYWIEFRWTEDGWCWRALKANTETIGMGAVLEQGWRSLKIGQTIRKREDITLLCIDDSPPEPIVSNIDTKQQYYGEALLEFIESFEDEFYVTGTVGRKPSLTDGELFSLFGQVFRFYSPVPYEQTDHHVLDLLDQDVWLEIDLEHQKAIFGNNQTEIQLSGASILVLFVYAEAVKYHSKWMTMDNAYRRWIEIGGNAKSTKRRINWERGKIRKKLTDEGVTGVKKLFAQKTFEGVYEFRLALDKSQISFAKPRRKD